MAHFKYDADEIIMLCRMGAMPYMKNIKIDFSEPMIVSGELRRNATIYQAYDSVLSILKANASGLSLLSSYGDTIEDIMKKIRKSDRYKITKQEPKLYLRINNINDIKTMNEQQKRALINNMKGKTTNIKAVPKSKSKRAKCQLCGKQIDTAKAYCIIKGPKKEYYCSEEEYHGGMKYVERRRATENRILSYIKEIIKNRFE